MSTRDEVEEIVDYLLDLAILYGPWLIILAKLLRKGKLTVDDLFWFLGPYFFGLLRAYSRPSSTS